MKGKKLIVKKVVRKTSHLGSVRKSLMNPGHVFYHMGRISAGSSLSVVSNAAGGAKRNFYFKLQDVINTTEFTSLYDQYKVLEHRMTFYPTANFNSLTNITGGAVGQFITPVYYRIDYDDVGTPASIDELLEASAMKVVNYGKVFTIAYVPSCNIQSATATTGMSVKSNSRWFDCADNTAIHQGVKLVAADMNIGAVQIYNVVHSIVLAFKGQR